MSQLEDTFAFQLRALHIKYEREVKLVAGRRYRWDFIVGDLAIEINGATWVKGAHSTGQGIQRDCDKGFEALKAGFRPLNITAKDVSSAKGVQKVIQLMGKIK